MKRFFTGESNIVYRGFLWSCRHLHFLPTHSFYQLFGLSFWRHPFTADTVNHLVSKWCNAKFLQILHNEELICILRVSRFFRTFFVICPFKLHLLVRFAVIKEQPTTTISCSWTLSLFKAIKHISIKLPHSLLYFSSSQLCRANLMIRCHVSLLQAVCESNAL